MNPVLVVHGAEDQTIDARYTLMHSLKTHTGGRDAGRKGDCDPCLAAAFFGYDSESPLKKEHSQFENSRQKTSLSAVFLYEFRVKTVAENSHVVNLLSKCCQNPK